MPSDDDSRDGEVAEETASVESPAPRWSAQWRTAVDPAAASSPDATTNQNNSATGRKRRRFPAFEEEGGAELLGTEKKKARLDGSPISSAHLPAAEAPASRVTFLAGTDGGSDNREKADKSEYNDEKDGCAGDAEMEYVLGQEDEEDAKMPAVVNGMHNAAAVGDDPGRVPDAMSSDKFTEAVQKSKPSAVQTRVAKVVPTVSQHTQEKWKHEAETNTAVHQPRLTKMVPIARPPRQTQEREQEDEPSNFGAAPRARGVFQSELPSQQIPGRIKESNQLYSKEPLTIPVARKDQRFETREHQQQQQPPSPDRERVETPTDGPAAYDAALEQQRLRLQQVAEEEGQQLQQQDYPPNPTPQRKRGFLERFVLSPKGIERPVGQEENAAPRPRVFVSTTFWFWILWCSFILACYVRNDGHWDWMYMVEYVVEGSDTLSTIYQGMLMETIGPAVAIDENVTLVTTMMELLPEGINQSIIDKKRKLQEENSRISKENKKIELANAVRRKQNSKRKADLDRIRLSNALVKEANDKMNKETALMAAYIEKLKEKSSSNSAVKFDLLATTQSLLNEFRVQKGGLDTLLTQVSSKHYDAEQKLGAAKKLLGKNIDRDKELLLLLSKIPRSEDTEADIAQARKIMGDAEKLILDFSGLSLWEPSTLPKCPAPASVLQLAVVQSKKKRKKKQVAPKGLAVQAVNSLVDNFIAEVVEGCEHLEQDGETVENIQNAVLEGIIDFPLENKLAQAPIPEITEFKDPTLDDVRELVSHRFDMLQADGTGRFDYASLHNGAFIVRQATSPSLVENLPVVNRVASMLSLQSYGYGPEAALSPTWPPEALGQCWAVEKVDIRQKRLGAFADLTVAFAKPIRVESVSIEHPPPERSDKSKSAIREFRIIGYEMADATGRGWNLGVFEYDVRDRRKPSRQEFQMSKKDFGEDIPSLHSITLAIDNNWGESFSCLYRFRVHGTPAALDKRF